MKAQQKNLLWYVQVDSLLARKEQGLKSDEVGRFKEFTVVEAVEKKGVRVHVRRHQGIGPDEGWVSSSVGGKETLKLIASPQEMMMFSNTQLEKIFGIPSYDYDPKTRRSGAQR